MAMTVTPRPAIQRRTEVAINHILYSKTSLVSFVLHRSDSIVTVKDTYFFRFLI